MTPKFKIGDKVKAKSGNIFEIETIVIEKAEVTYSAEYQPCYYLEENLELYTEPKPKVKKWFYLFKYKGGGHESMSTYPFVDDAAFKKIYTDVDYFQRLDWSMTEVDDNE